MKASKSRRNAVNGSTQLATSTYEFNRFRRIGSVPSKGLSRLIIPLLAISIPHWACCQTGASPLGQSDSQAMTIVQNSIQALGGEATWRAVGAATAQAVISSQVHPTQTVGWSDDWSTGRERFRRDSGQSSPITSHLIGSDALQALQASGGKVRYIPHDDGVAVLAMGYPAEALILSISQYHCRFVRGERLNQRIPQGTPDPDLVSVTEQCPNPFYPQGVAIMVWRFSRSTGMPISVDVPMWGITDHTVMTQTVTFGDLTNLQGLIIPSQLKIKRPTGWVDTVTISDTKFIPKLPDSTFQPAN